MVVIIVIFCLFVCLIPPWCYYEIIQFLENGVKWGNRNWTVSCTFLKEEDKNLGVILSNQSNCNFLCQSNPSCSHYVWAKGKESFCYLRRGPSHRYFNIVKNVLLCSLKINLLCVVFQILITIQPFIIKCKYVWFVLKRRWNGQRQHPGWTQFRHNKSRIEWWREKPYKDKHTLKII